MLNSRPKSIQPIVLVGISLLGIASFLNTYSAEFVWDDRAAVVYNADVSDPNASWVQVWAHDFWGQNMSDHYSHKSYRPITTLSFRFNYKGSTDNPSAYHWTNIGLHGLVCALVVVGGQVLGLSPTATVLGGLLFAVHPIHCDAVASIVGRADVLCTAFGLVALILHQRAWYGTSFFCILLGVFYLLLFNVRCLFMLSSDVVQRIRHHFGWGARCL